MHYDCTITAYEADETGESLSQKKLYAGADVSTKRTILGKLFDITIQPFLYGFGATVALLGMTLGMLLPVSPLIFLAGLLFGFFEGFKGLLA
jgi:hypothetical protein